MRTMLASLGCSVTLLAIFATPVVAGDHSTVQSTVPPKNECWTMDGPHGSGNEVYFNAANNCPEPRHCRVWVNWAEPPAQIHLDIGMKGRIDIGAVGPKDKLSFECVPVSPGM